MIPFIRANHALIGHVEGTAVPDELTAVTWMDGAHCPIAAAAVNEVSLEIEAKLKILSAKHAAATSATTQPCDLSPVFKVVKQAAKMGTAVTPPQRMLLKTIIGAMTSRPDILNLKDTQKKTMGDFLACVPANMTKAITSKNIIMGFTDAGMIDEETGTWPDFDKLLSTCRRHMTLEEQQLSHDLKVFHVLYSKFQEDGWISDDLLGEVGYKPDVNSQGEIVPRNAQITNESSQRVKLLLHLTQMRLRFEQTQRIRRPLPQRSRLQMTRLKPKSTRTSSAS